jgi:hypothetical protein
VLRLRAFGDDLRGWAVRVAQQGVAIAAASVDRLEHRSGI